MPTVSVPLDFPIAEPVSPVACAAAAGREERPCVLNSEELLLGRKEAWIEHRGEMYRLRLTGSGKLYLTK